MEHSNNRTWTQTLNVLQTTHTLSLREICQQMKCSRSWVNKYVHPYLDTIYLNSNIRNNEKTKGKINWLMMATVQLGREEYLTDSVWCSLTDFDNLIRKSIRSITYQTKLIPVELLVEDSKKYAALYDNYTDLITSARAAANIEKDINSIKQLNKLLQEQKLCHLNMLSNLGKKIIKEGLVNATKRNDAKPFRIDIDLPPISEWIAPHDIKCYGDTDESIYRNFFKCGYVKIVLSIKSKDNNDETQKVYYLPDQNPFHHKYIAEYLTISAEMYESIKEQLEKS